MLILIFQSIVILILVILVIALIIPPTNTISTQSKLFQLPIIQLIRSRSLSSAAVKPIIQSAVFNLGYRLFNTKTIGYNAFRLFTKMSAAANTNSTNPHSIVKPSLIQYGSFSVQPIPILSDNYSYLIIDNSSKQAAIVDPAQPEIVLKVLSEQKGIELTHILTTQ